MNRSTLKVLEAVMRLADAGRPITLRAIRDLLGWRNTNYVQERLRKLKNKGLVNFEPRLSGTIRPTCRFIPVEFLE